MPRELTFHPGSDIRSHSDTNHSRLENRTSSIGVAEIDPGEIPERQDGGDVHANRDHADPFTTSQDEQTGQRPSRFNIVTIN